MHITQSHSMQNKKVKIKCYPLLDVFQQIIFSSQKGFFRGQLLEHAHRAVDVWSNYDEVIMMSTHFQSSTASLCVSFAVEHGVSALC